MPERVQAGDGKAMRAALAEAVPDLVLLDLRLPGEDGLSLARWLRDNHDHFVSPGGCFRLECDGASLLYAMRRTHATLTAPRPENYARLITTTPAGTTTPRVLYEASRNKWGQTPFFSFDPGTALA
jgi:hypothetical protein